MTAGISKRDLLLIIETQSSINIAIEIIKKGEVH